MGNRRKELNTRSTAATQRRDHAIALAVAAATFVSIGLTAFSMGGAAVFRAATTSMPGAGPITATAAQQAASRLGPAFEQNVGQTAAEVQYLARTDGTTVFLTLTGAVFATPGQSPAPARGKSPAAPASPGYAMYMQLVGANAHSRATADDPFTGLVNYFLGNNPTEWHANVPTYGQVAFHDVYPGIDLVWYGNQGQLEYDFVLAPGADPAVIQMSFAGASSVNVDGKTGDLVVGTRAGAMREHAPQAYQRVAGGRSPVQGAFIVGTGGQVGFELGAYDRTLPLDIDPTVGYSTLIGGTGNDGGNSADGPYTQDGTGGSSGGIAVDRAGNAYIVDVTTSVDYPTTPGAYQSASRDMVVTKLNPAGTGLVYSTYVGGTVVNGHSYSEAYGIAVDAAGSVVVAGDTQASDYPITPGAYLSVPGGTYSAFATKISPTGSSLDFSTYLGGDATIGQAPAYDAAGDVYVVGQDITPNYGGNPPPTTPGVEGAIHCARS